MIAPNTGNSFKRCVKCRKEKMLSEFPYTESEFFPDQHSTVCFSCLRSLIDPRDFASVDALMRWLDLPFYHGQWAQFVAQTEDPLVAYMNFVNGKWRDEGDIPRWDELNKKWLEASKEEIEKEIPVLKREWAEKMKKDWPGAYTEEDYEFLQSLFTGLLAAHNISDPTAITEARQLCMLSLNLTRKIQKGDDASKDMKSYLDLKKSSGLEAKNARNYMAFDSVGELVIWAYKNGFEPTFAKETKDVVDLTMKDTQSYLRTLWMNEPGLADMVDKKKVARETSLQLEEEFGDGSTIQEIDEEIQYEGEDDLEVKLSDGLGE